MHKRYWNFAPRLGFAWDVNGDGRTSVRASGGTFYDRPTAIYFRNLTTVPPWTTRTDFRTSIWQIPGPPIPVEIRAGSVRRECAQNHTVAVEQHHLGLDYDTPNMRVGQYNLSIQRQLGSDWMVSANYIGNATRHLWTTQPINPVIYVPGVGDAQGRCFLNGAAVITR